MALWPLMPIVALFAWCRWAPMEPLFSSPRSTVLLDRTGGLLGATVASDGQWRMEAGAELPPRFVTALLEFEDRHFHHHHGVHLPSLVRAWRQNMRAGRTVSGGSTITMQLARMSEGAGPRTYGRKLLEILKALRLEMRMEKQDILREYAANAPFGANVVGLEAAAWRWFGREPRSLGWAECALLAVLPNAPARMHPGRGRIELKEKRDRLLTRLHEKGVLGEMDLSLALEEPLPAAPLPLPRLAPQLLTTMGAGTGRGRTTRTTMDAALQERITNISGRYAPLLRANEVHNAAVLVLDTRSGEVLAYMGNLPDVPLEYAPEVDIIQARRSTGSLLKPFLYAAMLQHGELMPDQLVADLPTQYEGFAPKNFDQRYTGAVPASRALARSLNVPAVRALHAHGIDRTLRMLRAMGLRHIDGSAGHYGLSLIVGGAESTLWELTGAYASMARSVLEYGGDATGGTAIHPPRIIPQAHEQATAAPPFSAAAAYHTLLALQELERPEQEQGWQRSQRGPIAWKTGTSYGHRDAWAIGVTGRYTVGVWTGNASGEGRPGLTGTLVAAPLMFEIFGSLPEGPAFDPPYDAMRRIPVCRRSGHRAGNDCEAIDTTWCITEAMRTDPCPYHRTILVDGTGRYRSAPGPGATPVKWFVLPPAMEHYHKLLDHSYRPLPPWPEGERFANERMMEMIYPADGARLFLPIGLDGRFNLLVLEAAHRDPQATIHWDVDGIHHGTTLHQHQLPLDIEEGRHRLTLTDHSGNSLTIAFQVERGSLTHRLP